MASHLEAGDAQAVGRLALQAVEAMTSNLPTIKVAFHTHSPKTGSAHIAGGLLIVRGTYRVKPEQVAPVKAARSSLHTGLPPHGLSWCGGSHNLHHGPRLDVLEPHCSGHFLE